MMTLKKQTIWLLTMLSLIIVLSVYYVQAPSVTPNEEVAFVDQDEDELAADEKDEQGDEELTDEEQGLVTKIEEEFEKVGEQEGEEDGDHVITNVTPSDTFAALRMELQAARDRLAEQYTEIVASEEASASMKSEAYDNNLQLLRLAQDEATLETLIKAKGYEDALVMAEEDQVHVIVRADELTKAEANEILRMTLDRFGKDANVAVSYQPSK